MVRMTRRRGEESTTDETPSMEGKRARVEKDYLEEFQSEALAEREVVADVINSIDSHGRTLLHRSALRGDVAKVSWLLSDDGGRKAGFDGVLAKDEQGETALHLATSAGHLDVIQALVEGSKVEGGERENLMNAVDMHKQTALYKAAHYYHRVPIIRWILSAEGGRAAGFKGIIKENNDDYLMVETVITFGQLEALVALAEGCKNYEETNILNLVFGWGSSILHIAAENQQVPIIQWILSNDGGRANGFNRVLAKNDRGETALHVAVDFAHMETFLALVEGYKVENAERAAILNAQDDFNCTVLQVAALEGVEWAVRWLLSEVGRTAGFNRENIFILTNHRESVLHLAAKSGNIANFEALVAACESHAERLRLLLGVDDEERTIFHHAAMSGQGDLLGHILRKYPEVSKMIIDRRNSRGMTALHRAIALKCEHAEMPTPAVVWEVVNALLGFEEQHEQVEQQEERMEEEEGEGSDDNNNNNNDSNNDEEGGKKRLRKRVLEGGADPNVALKVE